MSDRQSTKPVTKAKKRQSTRSTRSGKGKSESESKSESKTETKTESKTESKSESKAEIKSESKSASKKADPGPASAPAATVKVEEERLRQQCKMPIKQAKARFREKLTKWQNGAISEHDFNACFQLLDMHQFQRNSDGVTFRIYSQWRAAPHLDFDLYEPRLPNPFWVWVDYSDICLVPGYGDLATHYGFSMRVTELEHSVALDSDKAPLRQGNVANVVYPILRFNVDAAQRKDRDALCPLLNSGIQL